MSTLDESSLSRLALTVSRRRTFAIISHPDAGKTTLTEKLLLYGGAIREAGMVRAKQGRRATKSDWMEIERTRGISVTSSVLSFPHRGHHLNLVDTPGHEDFCEDTFRALAAVDAAVVLIDGAKGVEPQTLRLMEVCRRQRTPVLTFVNKVDRDILDPIDLFDAIERELGPRVAPMNLPVGSGPVLRGLWESSTGRLIPYLPTSQRGMDGGLPPPVPFDPFDPDAVDLFGRAGAEISALADFVAGTIEPFDRAAFLAAHQTPVFFGSALHDLGVEQLLDALVEHAPAPQPRQSDRRRVEADEESFTGFVFKIQANMDPRHRDRMAFVRICSGHFLRGDRVLHVRSGREIRLAAPTTFVAQDRSLVDEAWAGDIVGIHDPGLFRLGDTLSAGENLNFPGIPLFAPEHFARVLPLDPLRAKQVQKGLEQLTEEGAAQVFTPLSGPWPTLGVVGKLQFDVLSTRLAAEYGAPVRLEPLSIWGARWVQGPAVQLAAFRDRHSGDCGTDPDGHLVWLVPAEFRLRLAQEAFADLKFLTSSP